MVCETASWYEISPVQCNLTANDPLFTNRYKWRVVNCGVDRVVEKDANQLHLCHRRVMISPWNDGKFLARQTNTDNDDIGDNTNILEADSTSFIFLVALLAFIGQLASIFIGKLFLYVSRKYHR